MQLFFGKNKVMSIDTLFEDIQLGVYKNKAKFEDSSARKFGSSAVALRSTAETLSVLDMESLYDRVGQRIQAMLETKRGLEENINLSDNQVIEKYGIMKFFTVALSDSVLYDSATAKKDRMEAFHKLFKDESYYGIIEGYLGTDKKRN